MSVLNAYMKWNCFRLPTVAIPVLAFYALLFPAGVLVRSQQFAGLFWKDPVNGSFSTASRWQVNDERFQTVPFVDLTATIPPRPGDSVTFRDGSYEVSMAGAPSSILLIFENGASSDEVWDVTLRFSGDYTTDELRGPASQRVTFSGTGILRAGTMLPGGAAWVVDGLEFRIGDIPFRGSGGNPDPLRELLITGGAKLVTEGRVNLTGITVIGSEWVHAGPEDGLGKAPFSGATPQITMDGGRLSSAGIRVNTAHTTVGRNGATLEIGNYYDEAVQLESGSVMRNVEAEAGSFSGDGRTFVDGAGSLWAVTGLFRVRPAAGVVVRREGRLTAGQVHFDEPSYGALTVSGAGSVVEVAESLTGNGTVRVNEGGLLRFRDSAMVGGAVVMSDGAGSLVESSGLITGSGRLEVANGARLVADRVNLSGTSVRALSGGSLGASELSLEEGTFAGSGGALMEVAAVSLQGPNTIMAVDQAGPSCGCEHCCLERVLGGGTRRWRRGPGLRCNPAGSWWWGRRTAAMRR